MKSESERCNPSSASWGYSRVNVNYEPLVPNKAFYLIANPLPSVAANELGRWRGRFAPTIRRPHRTVVHASTLTRSPAADPHPRYAYLVLK